MSILIRKGKPPEGAITVTKDEAIIHQWQLIYNWKPTSDVWPFRHGLASLAIGTIFSSISIVRLFRRKLQLRNIGHFAMFLPNVVIPAATLPLLHQKLVSESIFLQNECPVCIQLRSICLQNILGLGYPLILAPTCGFMLASSQATYRLPILSFGNLGTLFKIFSGIVRPFTNRLLVLSLFQTVLALCVTEAEARSMFKIQKILLEEQNHSKAQLEKLTAKEKE